MCMRVVYLRARLSELTKVIFGNVYFNMPKSILQYHVSGLSFRLFIEVSHFRSQHGSNGPLQLFIYLQVYYNW